MSIPEFRISESAVARLSKILPEHGPFLRVAVLAGGCNGFQYKFDLTGARAEDDLLIERGPAKVLIDPVSLDLLAGSELDYADKLMGSYFTVHNPQAASSCGCGTSFSMD